MSTSVTAAAPAAPVRAAGTPAPAPLRFAAPVTVPRVPPPTPPADTIAVQLVKDGQTGVDVVQFINKENGEVIAALPPVQVLRVVAGLVALSRERDRHRE